MMNLKNSGKKEVDNKYIEYEIMQSPESISSKTINEDRNDENNSELFLAPSSTRWKKRRHEEGVSQWVSLCGNALSYGEFFNL